MKAFKFILLTTFTLACVSSCTTEEYYTNNVDKEQWHVEEFEILGNHWVLVGEPNEIGSYYEYIFDKIPLEVSYYDGIVTAYMFLNYGTKDEIQVPLPYTEYHIDSSGEQEINYSIQYSYDVKSDGTIAFKIYVSDYYTGLFSPTTQYFRVAIIWEVL